MVAIRLVVWSMVTTYASCLDVVGVCISIVEGVHGHPEATDEHEDAHDEVKHKVEGSLRQNAGRTKGHQRRDQHDQHRQPVGEGDQQQVPLTLIEAIVVDLQKGEDEGGEDEQLARIIMFTLTFI